MVPSFLALILLFLSRMQLQMFQFCKFQFIILHKDALWFLFNYFLISKNFSFNGNVFVSTCINLFKLAETRLLLSNLVEICPNIYCVNLSKLAWICPTCPNLSKLAQTCPNLSKIDLMGPNLLFFRIWIVPKSYFRWKLKATQSTN